MAILTAYFSATGTTKKIAEKVAAAAGADLFEIRPEVPYTGKDLNWMDKNSRTTVEMNNRSMRPAIVKAELDTSKYDTVLLGFPIWWYVAPTIINTFLESYDFAGKKIVLFATSGGSSFGNAVNELKLSAPQADIREGAVLTRASDAKIREFAASV